MVPLSVSLCESATPVVLMLMPSRSTSELVVPLAAIPMSRVQAPVLAVSREGLICDANVAAETFFQLSHTMLLRLKLEDILPFGSPLLSAVDHALERGSVVNEYRVDIGTPRIGTERVVDINVAPI